MTGSMGATGRAGLTRVERRVLLNEVRAQNCLLCARGLPLRHSSEPRAVCGVGKRFPGCVGDANGFKLMERV